MTKWYIYELSAFIGAVTALLLGFYVSGYFFTLSAFLGGSALAFWAIEEEVEREGKRVESGLEAQENETEKWYRENGYDFLFSDLS